MGFVVLTGVRLFAVSADLTGASNKVELAGEFEEKDRTTYGSNGWKEVMAGLGSAEIQSEGFWEAGSSAMVDDASWAQLGGEGPWTVAPVGASVGDLAYLVRAHRAEYGLLGAVGDIAPWKGKASSTWPLVRGSIAHPPGTARTSSGTGSGVELGAVTTGQRLYAALHVLSVSGTTPAIDVIVESDADSGFASPTTRITFSQASAVSAEISRTDGSAITDTWYRVKWTVSGASPSFLFAAAFGVM
jgi:hypothetical protein